MPTSKQELGTWGEKLISREIDCPGCKRQGTLLQLPRNFKCADIICDFCGYLAQVKSNTTKDVTKLPDFILGAAWKPQNARMESGIYFPLFLVLYKSKDEYAIYYLPPDLQHLKLFMPRNPLSLTAKKAGWQGFVYVLKDHKHLFTRLK